MPVPEHAPAPFPAHPKLGRPSQRWRYDDDAGRLLGYVCRFDAKDGGKEYRPLTYGRRNASRQPEWRWETWPPQRPLYGLAELARRPDARVLVTEGEKSCDAARKLLPDFVVVTSPGGAKAPAKADWTTLAGRAVTIWPDADISGKAYAKAVAGLVTSITESVAVIEPPANAPEGFDAADALGLGWNAERVMEDLVRGAKSVVVAGPKSEKGGRIPRRDEIAALLDDAQLWHDSKRVAYATIQINGHKENWRIRSHDMKLLLRYFYLKSKDGQPGGQALEDALGGLEARAVFDGPEYEVFIRTAAHGGKNYVDLCDEAWRAVEIDADGWRVVENPPAKFIRTAAMRALPVPEHDPDRTIDELLAPFLNAKTAADRMLMVAWLVAALRPQGPYAVLAVGGEAGTAKSSACQFLRRLIDPNKVLLRSLPRDDAALWVGADNCYVLAYDNVSHIDDWLSNSLCRIAHGGGMTVRTLYRDRDEESFDACRPVLFNGIGSLANRSDLADRCLVVALDLIPQERRRAEEEIAADFHVVQPNILAALLDGAASAMRRIGSVKLDSYSRMADFERWIYAAAPGLGYGADEVLKAYRQNREGAVRGGL